MPSWQQQNHPDPLTLEPEEILARDSDLEAPAPRGRWWLRQQLRELLFVHWPLSVRTLRDLVPHPLEIDALNHRGWVTAAFFTAQVRPRWLPNRLTLSLTQLSLRTYVRLADRPGIYFFTIATSSRMAALFARLVYGLPARHAQLHIDDLAYSSRDRSGATFLARVDPGGPAFVPGHRSLEHFLLDRYRLYVPGDNTRVRSTPILHPPWTIQRADVSIESTSLLAREGLALEGPHLAHYAVSQQELVWAPQVAIHGRSHPPH